MLPVSGLVSVIVSAGSCSFDSDSLTEKSGVAFFQNFWEPCLDCCDARRVGRRGDGGKWLCADAGLAEEDKIISVGSNNEFSFETGLLEMGVKTVHVYDHTSKPSANTRIKFFRLEMTPERLFDILLKLSRRKSRVSILKVDCEGCEYGLFTDKILNLLCSMDTQILVEVHWTLLRPPAVAKLWKRFASHGFAPFHKEPNIQFSRGDCVELSLMKIPGAVCS